MGLDLVELVYRIEEEFEITIPDEVAETLTTPKMVTDYLMSLPKVSEEWSRSYVEITFWQLLEDETGVNRKDYDENSRFIEDIGLD